MQSKIIFLVIVVIVSVNFAAGDDQNDTVIAETETSGQQNGPNEDEDAGVDLTTSDYTTEFNEEWTTEDYEDNQIESKLAVQKVGKKKIKFKGPSKKLASTLLPLLMIPLMIQMQMMPMILLKLKVMAMKALFVGKLALIIIGLNVLRNAMIGADDIDHQYEQETLASHHYGYTGEPEVGAWVNRRKLRSADPYRWYS